MDSVVCARTVSRRTALPRAEICKYFMSHCIGKDPILDLNFTWQRFFQGMDMDRNGQFYLNEFTETIVKVYHDEEGDAEEA